MFYYEKFRNVPEEAKKTIQAGKLKGFTDINPMWRIKSLTETFGPTGEGWRTDDVKMWTESAGGETAAFCTLNLYVKINGNWSSPIFGIGGSKLAGKGVGDGINDEAFKMAYTDALSIACKALGMAADVYYNKDCKSTDNRTKYDSVVEPNSGEVFETRRNIDPTSYGMQAPAQPTYQPMNDAMYWQYVAAEAQGIPTTTGQSCRAAWIAYTHAGKEQIDTFDGNVQSYRASHNIH